MSAQARRRSVPAALGLPARGLAGVVAVLALLAALPARAGTTDTLPAGAFLLDTSYVIALTDKQFDRNRREVSLIEPIKRYEAGGGWQGTLRARPTVDMRMFVTQLLYGITDRWVAGVVVPVAVETTIVPNLDWTPGDWNSSLGRPYSEKDFWEWAGSLGQPKPAATWRGNVWTPADLVLASRYRLPETDVMRRLGLRWAVMVQAALPTGREVDPEEVIDIGTSGWWLHNFGDLELHLAADWRLRDAAGVDRLTVGIEAWYAWLRTKTLQTPTGAKNPLLLTYSPYVGDTHEVDGGDWQAARLTVDVVPLIGPTFGTWMTKGSVAAAAAFPPLLSLNLSYDCIYLQPTVWTSHDPIWSDERARYWGEGYKHAFAATVTLSLMRLGAPLQLYVRQRSLDIVAGQNMRPANATAFGVRLLAKFW